MSRQTECPNLRTSLERAIKRAEHEVQMAKASLAGISAGSLRYTAGRLSDVGRSITWDGEVIERDLDAVIDDKPWAKDELPADLTQWAEDA